MGKRKDSASPFFSGELCFRNWQSIGGGMTIAPGLKLTWAEADMLAGVQKWKGRGEQKWNR